MLDLAYTRTMEHPTVTEMTQAQFDQLVGPRRRELRRHELSAVQLERLRSHPAMTDWLSDDLDGRLFDRMLLASDPINDGVILVTRYAHRTVADVDAGALFMVWSEDVRTWEPVDIVG